MIVAKVKKRNIFVLICAGFILSLMSSCSNAAVRNEKVVRIWLSSLDLSKMTVGWGKPAADKNIVGKPLSIANQKFEHGVGSHAGSMMYIDLHGEARHFSARVGVDDETQGRGTVRFKVYGDGKKLFDSGVMKGGDKAKPVELNLRKVQQVVLVVTGAGDNTSYDHANWADAYFEYQGEAPLAVDAPEEEKLILTPKPGPKPKINGPKVYGARPGNPFLYRIPAAGKRPMRFSAENLPATLTLDSKTGIITGNTPKQRAEYTVTLKASNKHGSDVRPFRIVAGDKLALTPPMGWNHWYTHYNNITGAHMRKAADAMVDSGMVNYGYQYVNIDDCWMNAPNHRDPLRVGPLRDEDGNIISNKHFPDMRALTDYIHAKGLKAGIYTSPGPFTCAGFAGSWQHEKLDALQFASWGFDFLKYDWCSYGRKAKDNSLEEMQKPYRLMGEILKSLDRDIVLNLCQYGMGDVWKWGAEVGGNCWRTSGDLGFELTRYHEVAVRNASFHEYAKPGAWNDPDYLLLGTVGNARRIWDDPIPCPLTPNEQYSYMSLWCLMASPLFFTGDMSRLDDFTLNILCNAEVIEINQDSLGRQGYRVLQDDEKELEVWKKPLEDGSAAVGLFNQGEIEQTVTVKWQDISFAGKCRVRDLWRQKNEGEFDRIYSAPVKRNGVKLIRVWPAK